MEILMEIATPGVATPIEIAFLAPVIKQALNEADILEGMLLRPTRTWSSKSIPSFKSVANFQQDDWVHDITTSDTPYLWVTDGTKGGAADFSHDYRPKSKVGTLGAGQGGGRLLRRGARAFNRRDTEPRHFQDTAVKQREKPFRKNMIKAVTIGTRKMFVGTRVQVIVI